jgi:hypothetical protein
VIACIAKIMQKRKNKNKKNKQKQQQQQQQQRNKQKNHLLCHFIIHHFLLPWKKQQQHEIKNKRKD